MNKGSRSDIARGARIITPSDTADVVDGPCAIRAGADGTIRLQAIGSGRNEQPVIDHPVVKGEIINVLVKRVYASGTNAGTLIGYFA